MENSLTIIAGTALFFVVAILLVVILLVAKKYLVPSGNVKITINEKDVVEAPSGG
ncbi:MAG: NADH:ubiquinone reductase (Na(+)-transporting) subunit F, partial [Bacteroidales bacterium]|nr:NADH:ubiquinone reductase (Na(+)-transporting) subunit F [Bacteroidales bacterium]